MPPNFTPAPAPLGRSALKNFAQRTQRVPPGLAKKPGQMPPGQYKKLTNVSAAPNYLMPYQGAKPGLGYTGPKKHPKNPKPGPAMQKGY